MKKLFVLTLLVNAFTFGALYAEDAPPAQPVADPMPAAEVAQPVEAAMPAEAPVAEAAPEAVAPAETAAPAGEAPAEPLPADNLEFISGEITAMDEAAKTVTVKMYGETAEAESDKMLTVSVDGNTDITDGEQDRALKSLTAGTEVDVEYDPTSKKATYIFVY